MEIIGNTGGNQISTLVTFKDNTDFGNIAKDADYLEMAFTAKEYIEIGYEGAWDWINNVGRALRTDSVKLLHAALIDTSSNEWWSGLKTFPKSLYPHQK